MDSAVGNSHPFDKPAFSWYPWNSEPQIVDSWLKCFPNSWKSRFVKKGRRRLRWLQNMPVRVADAWWSQWWTAHWTRDESRLLINVRKIIFFVRVNVWRAPYNWYMYQAMIFRTNDNKAGANLGWTFWLLAWFRCLGRFRLFIRNNCLERVYQHHYHCVNRRVAVVHCFQMS